VLGGVDPVELVALEVELLDPPHAESSNARIAAVTALIALGLFMPAVRA
jgi:hypothetical protein